MRIRQFVSSLAGFALLLGAGPALVGQTSTVVLSGGVAGSGGGFGSGSGVAGGVAMRVPGEPYTAIRKTTRVQKLANGTTITHMTTVKEARDSSGRTYRETRPEVPAGQEEGVPKFVFANVNDPVSGTNIHWNSNTKVADVTHFAERSQIKPPDVVSTQAAPEPTPVPRAEPIKQQSEDLGTKTINGVEARGTRMTRVISAGRDGNDQPLTITSEWWRSEELGIMVMSVNDDPRTGTTTMELTELEKGEPDPALFQVPEGYTVKDQFPGQQN